MYTTSLTFRIPAICPHSSCVWHGSQNSHYYSVQH